MWPRTTLGGLCDAGQYGLNAAALKEGGGVRFIRITDIDASGQLGGADPAYVAATTQELDRYELNPGDLLIARSGATAGKSMLFRGLSERAVFAGYLIRFKSRADLVLPEYLAYYMQSPAYWGYIRKTARAVAQPNINARELASLPVPLAPASEQGRIVDLLSRAENIVRMRREAEARAKEIIPALFLDMFGDPARNERGWEVRSVGDVIRSAEYGTSTKSSADGAGIPVIRMGNVDASGRLSLDDLKYVVLPEQEQRKYALAAGDILFNRTNSKELVGKTGIWRGVENAVAASYFIRVRVDDAVVAPDYLWAFMNSQHMKRVLFGTARGAIGQSNINAQELRALSVPVPPIAKQRAFADRAVQALGLEGQQAAATSQASLGFQSLLAGVFGEGA